MVNTKIFVAGVWGFGNISIMEQFENDSQVQFLKYDFQYFHQIAKVWKFIKRKLSGHGTGFMRWLLKTRVFDSKYALTYCDYKSNDMNYVVIFNSALLQYYSKEYFQRLQKKNGNIKFILYIIDPMPEGLWPEIKSTLEVFDKVMTIHPYNCKRYGFEYLPYIYAEPKEKSKKKVEETNLFFCGVMDTERENIIKALVEQCMSNQVPFDFWLKPYEGNEINNEYVHYAEMPYAENVERVKHSQCILEVMHEGFVGITQRYLEAIVYGKKLLTNNKEIKNLPYYNPKSMYYFENVMNIDWNWIKSDEKVDYHYQGEFEPETWKRSLVQMME